MSEDINDNINNDELVLKHYAAPSFFNKLFNKRFKKIITHTDFDGLISAMILRELLDIDEVSFSEPWLISSGQERVSSTDLLVDLPFDKRVGAWIDHHKSNALTKKEIAAAEGSGKIIIFDANKKSCPSLIKDYLLSLDKKNNHEEIEEQPNPEQERILSRAKKILSEYDDLIAASDKIDSAELSLKDIESPDDYGLISLSLRSNNRLRDDDYRRYLMDLLSFRSVSEVIKEPIVAQRIKDRLSEISRWEELVKDYYHYFPKEKVILLDQSEVDDLPRGNRFLLYTKHPDARYLVIINKVKNDPELLKVSIGKNIFLSPEKKPTIDLSSFAKRFGGGGHEDVCGISIPRREKDSFIKGLLSFLGGEGS